MSTPHFLRRTRRFGVGESSVDLGYAYTLDWYNRVLRNGGAAPSLRTTFAVQTLCQTLAASSLDSKIIAMCIFVQDNYVAARTPIIRTAGNDPWTEIGGGGTGLFLSNNGICGNSARYLDTGIDPSTAYSNDNSAGITLYNLSSSDSTSENDAGIHDLFAFYIDFSTFAFFDCWNTSGGRISASNSGWVGFLSANRTSATASAIYKASDTVPFSTLVSSTTESSIGTRPSGNNIYVFMQSITGTQSTKMMSLAAIHLGFSSTEAQTFFNALQACRKTLGGGWI